MVFVAFSRGVLIIEGSLSIVLSFASLILLFRRSLLQSQIVSIITSCTHLIILGFFISFLQMHNTCSEVHFISCSLNPSLSKLSPTSFNFLFTTFVTSFFATWKLIPGHSILQYLMLTRKDASFLQKVTIAYTMPVLLIVMELPGTMDILPPRDRERVLEFIFERVIGIKEDLDSHCAGAPTSFNNPNHRSVLPMLLLLVVSILLSLGLFLLTSYKSYSFLISRSSEVSATTRSLHMRFLIFLFVMQVVPLAVLILPSFAFIFQIFSARVNYFTNVLSLLLWIIPCLQAGGVLYYVHGYEADTKLSAVVPTVRSIRKSKR